MQATLLRVLEEGEFERVGSSHTRRVDVRVVAATHSDLEAEVEAGRFREDLFYRLGVFLITLPPLRLRREDIPQLVWCFIDRRQQALNRQIEIVEPALMASLQAHSWPGNVRELENVIERALIRSRGNALELDEIPRARRALHTEGQTLEAIERRHIEETLRRCDWRINGAGNAADTLGLNPSTLRFRMRKLGITRAVTPTSAGASIPGRSVPTSLASA